MSISRKALENIEAAPTAVESFKFVMDALVEDQTVSKDVCGLVKHALDHAADALEPAIKANTNN